MKFTSLALMFLLLFGCFGFTGCQKGNGIGGTTIGDGKIDPVEAATISFAVGIAMSARPSAILPAYGVSTALLALLSDNTQSVTIPILDAAVAKEVAKLNLDPITKQSFNDLVTLIKAEISSRLKVPNLGESEKLIVVKQFIQIVHDSAAARLEIIK